MDVISSDISHDECAEHGPAEGGFFSWLQQTNTTIAIRANIIQQERLSVGGGGGGQERQPSRPVLTEA